MSATYCRECGQKKTAVESGYYNETSGEKLIDYMCKNAKCRLGCIQSGGHRIGIFSITCRRCGFADSYGDYW